MVRASAEIQRAVCESYGQFFARLSGLPAEKCAQDVLDEDKAHQNIALLCRCTGLRPEELAGKRLLEIGSGFGIFLAVANRDYGLAGQGIEPASHGFDSSFQLSRRILEEYRQDPQQVIPAEGENLPFSNNTFDFIYSSTVLEHTQNPARVLEEAIRVLKPGGHLMFVYPNYGAFFEGHYVIPWIPYLPRTAAHLWVRLWGRDPSFLKTLCFTSHRWTTRWLKSRHDIDVLTLGQDIFRARMLGAEHDDWDRWAGLHRVYRWVKVLRRLRIVAPVTTLLLRLGSFDPLILTLRKRHPGHL